MILFKWILMIAGGVMVAAAILIMLKVIHAGATGTLRKKHILEHYIPDDLVADTTIATVDNW
jgi:hypothetical protein